jgi:NadR type nicotinamide-nucleotide adenylyltransferase
MKRGLVIGKFYPPHMGHSFLIKTASQKVDELFVLVCDDPRQKIPAQKRAGWLQKIHPKSKVLVIEDILQDDDSKAWAKHVKNFLGFAPDIVFTSENYGFTFSKELNCEHVLVDIERKNIPISATKIRNDLLNNLNFLDKVVRKEFVLRIVVVGAESTGTTTLAKELAKHYQTNFVPEYGRSFSENLADLPNYTWKDSDFEHIANIQNQIEDYMAETANKVLICDTDSFATTLWQRRYMGKTTKEVSALNEGRNYDLYILTGDEIPFVQDGTRDGEFIRHDMHNWFETELKNKNKKYILVNGSGEERMKIATDCIDKLITEKTF